MTNIILFLKNYDTFERPNLNFSTMKKICSFIIVVVLTIIGSTKMIAQNTKWLAPKYSNSMVNPFKGNVNATKEGKEIYNQMCVICHGLTGKGNGQAGLTLEPKPANFLALKVMKETDGAIFWKITEGKPPMSSYDELLREDQRWKLVNYIRQLGNK